jgi:hypothetical protein
VGSLPEFKEDVDPLLRGQLSPVKGVGGIGLFECVENANYLLHGPSLLFLAIP